MGLAVARRLTEAMGGELGVETQAGVGSTFWVELPTAEGCATAPATAGPDEASPVPEVAHTIVYVEDNPSNATLLRRVLARRPQIELLVATDGQSGLELIAERTPDLVLLDLHLPDLDGSQVLQKLRAEDRFKTLPILMVTADAMQAQHERLMALGADAYLTKPLDVRSFLETIDRLLE